MKILLLRIGLCLMIMSVTVHPAQSDKKAICNYDPYPVRVIVPKYPVMVLARSKPKQTELVQVDVEVDNEGKVQTAKVIKGFPNLAAVSKEAAMSWRFNTLQDGREGRKASLIFVFRIMPPNTPSKDLTTIFTPPYEIEIRTEWFDPSAKLYRAN